MTSHLTVFIYLFVLLTAAKFSGGQIFLSMKKQVSERCQAFGPCRVFHVGPAAAVCAAEALPFQWLLLFKSNIKQVFTGIDVDKL